jgi:hypothetical protein
MKKKNALVIKEDQTHTHPYVMESGWWDLALRRLTTPSSWGWPGPAPEA